MPGTNLPGRRQAGLTLVELTIGLAILSVLLAVGSSSFLSILRESQLSAQINEMASTLNIARSEAIKRGKRVVICRSNSGDAETPACTDTGWNQGWLVFVDENADSSFNAADSDILLRAYSAINSNYTLDDAGGSFDQVIYNPSGSTTAADTFQLCYGSDPAYSRELVVYLSGSIETRQAASACPS